MRKFVLAIVAATTLAAAPAYAQLGGLGRRLTGGSNDNSSVSGDQVDQFLVKTFNATKYVATAMVILNEAAKGHDALSAKKEEIKALASAPNTKEINARKELLTSTGDALSKNDKLVDQVTATYQSGNAKEKAMISAAIYNFALYLPQLAKMPSNISDLVKGIGSNPALIGKVGELKTAGSLIGIQIKGTTTIASALPKLMTAAKVSAPTNPETSKGKDIELD